MPRLRTDFGYIIYWQESGGSYYPGGFTDPLMAVQAIEEAISVDGMVWVSDDSLRNIRAIRATQIEEAEVAKAHEWKSTLSSVQR